MLDLTPYKDSFSQLDRLLRKDPRLVSSNSKDAYRLALIVHGAVEADFNRVIVFWLAVMMVLAIASVLAWKVATTAEREWLRLLSPDSEYRPE